MKTSWKEHWAVKCILMCRSKGALKTEGFLWILAARITNKRRGRRLRGAKAAGKGRVFSRMWQVCVKPGDGDDSEKEDRNPVCLTGERE